MLVLTVSWHVHVHVHVPYHLIRNNYDVRLHPYDVTLTIIVSPPAVPICPEN